jgi:hypothetical protein
VLRLRTDALTDVMETAHALGSRWTIRVLFWSTVLVLLVFGGSAICLCLSVPSSA